MLERVKGDIVFTCDGCDETLETETDDFEDARNEMKRAKWRTSKAGDTWVHHCVDCQPTRWWED